MYVTFDARVSTEFVPRTRRGGRFTARVVSRFPGLAATAVVLVRAGGELVSEGAGAGESQGGEDGAEDGHCWVFGSVVEVMLQELMVRLREV